MVQWKIGPAKSGYLSISYRTMIVGETVGNINYMVFDVLALYLISSYLTRVVIKQFYLAHFFLQSKNEGPFKKDPLSFFRGVLHVYLLRKGRGAERLEPQQFAGDWQ